ncbi:MAG TPA: hypothetical protein VEQ84_05040 [Vicinamibacteria bacterium]|nr:hypothetical protein [Vicinamibacteria bacterium]
MPHRPSGLAKTAIPVLLASLALSLAAAATLSAQPGPFEILARAGPSPSGLLLPAEA